MCESPLFLLTVLALWAFLAVLLVAIGRGVGRWTPGIEREGDLFLAFWTGWSAVLAGLQLWHLVLPIDGRATALVAVLGGAALAARRRELGALARHRFTAGAALVTVLTVLTVLVAALAVAVAAAAPLRYFDTGFYHLTTLGWIERFAIVPGLANLHGRLAFNSSFHLWAALLDFGPWAGRVHHVANGLPVVVVLVRALGDLRAALRRPRPDVLFGALLAGPIVAQVLGGSVSSLSTDLPAFCLILALARELVALVAAPPAAGERPQRLGVLALIAATAVAVKLSLLIFSASAMLLAVVLVDRRPATLARAAGAVAIVLVPWVVRSAILSGYGVFPGGLLPLPVDWRLPRPLMLEETRRIYSLARSTTAHWAETLGTWDWIGAWWRDLPSSPKRHLVLWALALPAALVRGSWRSWAVASTVVLPAVAGLAGWFLTAPNPRFVAPLLAVVTAGLVSAGGWRGRGALAAVASVAVVLAPALGESANDGPWCELPRPAVESSETVGGLEVYRPVVGIQCWTLPLPCTPYPRPSLELRRPGELGGGFRLAPGLTYGSSEDPPVPLGFTLSSDLGVNLVSGWRRPELAEGRRVLGARGRLLVYSGRPVMARLRLTASAISAGDGEESGARLSVHCDGEPVEEGRLRVGRPFELRLELHEGFNDLVLETRLPGSSRRRVSVTIDQIEIRSSPP